MTASIAGHLVLLLLALWLIGKGIEPAPSSWVLDLSLQAKVSEEHADSADHQEPVVRAATADEAVAPANAPSTRKSETVPERAEARARSVGQPAPALRMVPPEPSALPVSESIEALPSPELQPAPETVVEETRAPVLASSVPQEIKVPVPVSAVSVERVVMSTSENRMFEKKFRQWTRDFHDFDPDEKALTWKHRGQEYRARFEHFPAAGQTDMDHVRVRIETDRDGLRLSTDMRMKRLAFSNFAQFVNRWDPAVLVHDDVLSGRFHSNTKINLASDREARPEFHGKVTISSREIGFPGARGPVRRKEIFLGGLETGVRRILLPRRFSPFRGKGSPESSRTHRFDDDTRIVFYADGSFGHRPIDSEAPEQRQAMQADAAYFIGAPRRTLELSGVVRGKVLVYSPERITIAGDLTYSRHPLDSDGEGDYLGLVSDKYVDIAPPEVTGPGDLEIHASIYAKRRFSVRNYRKRHEATLYLFGSLTAGTMSATEPRYATRIEYDERLEDQRAPGFPVTDRYEVVGFNESWRIDPL